MQALYAHSMRPDQDVFVAENEMIHTIKNCYTLFLWFFSILPEVAYYRSNKLEDLKTNIIQLLKTFTQTPSLWTMK